MPIFTVIKKDHKTCLAWDSFIPASSNHNFHQSRIIGNNKILQKDEYYFYVDGDLTYNHALENYLLSLDSVSFLSENDVFIFANKFHQILKDNYFLVPYSDEDDAVESSHCTILIINKEFIFQIYPHRSVVNFKQYQSIGNGTGYALGSIYSLLDTSMSAKEIAIQSIETTIYFEKYSSLPVNFIEI